MEGRKEKRNGRKKKLKCRATSEAECVAMMDWLRASVAAAFPIMSTTPTLRSLPLESTSLRAVMRCYSTCPSRLEWAVANAIKTQRLPRLKECKGETPRDYCTFSLSRVRNMHTKRKYCNRQKIRTRISTF
ncbi:hypothetical protein AVEN_211460-1 [Araneus ventricosus]|uniref:Uncharacterized protein n=1 Tax=Araneus ventricosus TaxID=182803 RepID=A0A4Y2LUK8_ARAVE|nr:hypothetical protein AVEN_211460-1 [Araneus ventricosus]